jgi:hypothetical protein
VKGVLTSTVASAEIKPAPATKLIVGGRSTGLVSSEQEVNKVTEVKTIAVRKKNALFILIYFKLIM